MPALLGHTNGSEPQGVPQKPVVNSVLGPHISQGFVHPKGNPFMIFRPKKLGLKNSPHLHYWFLGPTCVGIRFSPLECLECHGKPRSLGRGAFGIPSEVSSTTQREGSLRRYFLKQINLYNHNGRYIKVYIHIYICT